MRALPDHDDVAVAIDRSATGSGQQLLRHLVLRALGGIEDEQAVAPDHFGRTADPGAEVDDALELLPREELEAPVEGDAACELWVLEHEPVRETLVRENAGAGILICDLSHAIGGRRREVVRKPVRRVVERSNRRDQAR